MKRQIVGIVLDGSGSMSNLWKEILGAVNQQMETLRKTNEGFDTSIVFTKFSSKVDVPQVYRNINNAPNIPLDTQLPGGMTALYEAVYQTINQMNAVEGAVDNDTTFLLHIFTDGLENNSSSAVKSILPGMLQELDKTERWTITYVGTDHDIKQGIAGLGISAGNAYRFAKSANGVLGLNVKLCSDTTKYREAIRAESATSTKCFTGGNSVDVVPENVIFGKSEITKDSNSE